MNLDERIEKIAREMCSILGLEADKLVKARSKMKQWQVYIPLIKENLESDAFVRARSKYWSEYQ